MGIRKWIVERESQWWHLIIVPCVIVQDLLIIPIAKACGLMEYEYHEKTGGF